MDKVKQFNPDDQNYPDENTNHSIPSIKTEVTDSLSKTYEIIHQKDRRRKLEGKIRSVLIFVMSLILSASVIAVIGILQYDEYFAFINLRFDYIERSQSFCDGVTIGNIDIISTSIAGALIIFYIILYKRRVFLRYKYKYRNIGLP